jgi:hypothetical protein
MALSATFSRLLDDDDDSKAVDLAIFGRAATR